MVLNTLIEQITPLVFVDMQQMFIFLIVSTANIGNMWANIFT